MAQQPRLYVGMLLILIFAEALALYGEAANVSVMQSRSFTGLIIGLVVSLVTLKDGCVPYTGVTSA